MEGASKWHVVRMVLVGLGKNVVPPPESDENFHGHGDKAFGHDRVFLEKILGKPRDHVADVLDGHFALAGHHRGVSEHVLVVRDIDRQEAFGRPSDFPILPISLDGLEIAIDRLLPAPAPDVDVRWHVDIVCQARLQLAQAVGRSIGALRIRRCFDRMDVKVIRR